MLTLCVPQAAAADSWWNTLGSFFSREQNVNKYRIYDSNTVVHTFGVGQPQFYWINNEELIFVPMHIIPDASAPNKERYSFSVSRWNIRTGVIDVLHKFGEIRPRLCFFAGYVTIKLRPPGGHGERVLHGPLGEERQDAPNRPFNDVVCRPADSLPQLPAWTKGRQIRWLQSLDAGFIDFGEINRAREYKPLRLYRHGAKQEEGIQLALHDGLVVSRFPYYAFKNAFLVIGDWPRQPPPQDAPYPAYWLYQDGHVETIADIPWGPWRRASLSISPTRAGLLLASSHFKSPDRPEHAGLYLFAKDRVHKLSAAWINGLAVEVSPDGCRAAFAAAPTVTRKTNVLKAIDVCAENPK
ncbi:MAG TPA: hypothetical protein VED01_05330 [Burkholderiales bacterium]|nr:hypothetical protein [Burkholderiales bacterium]